jgi:hypothetical protein
LKSAGPQGPWGFESLALRQLTQRTGAATLLRVSRCTARNAAYKTLQAIDRVARCAQGCPATVRVVCHMIVRGLSSGKPYSAPGRITVLRGAPLAAIRVLGHSSDVLTRRRLLAGTLSLLISPLAAEAQDRPRVGILGPGEPNPGEMLKVQREPFEHGLRELG